jgi:hypothetical protein
MADEARRLWLRTTLLCGTLDLGYAVLTTAARGRGVMPMLADVASGPLGSAVRQWGAAGALAGVLVHFALMGVMVAVGKQMFARKPLCRLHPWAGGTLYGLAIWLVMYGVVLPARFGVRFPNPDPVGFWTGLFPHVLLVGVPMAYAFRRRSTDD